MYDDTKRTSIVTFTIEKIKLLIQDIEGKNQSNFSDCPIRTLKISFENKRKGYNFKTDICTCCNDDDKTYVHHPCKLLLLVLD